MTVTPVANSARLRERKAIRLDARISALDRRSLFSGLAHHIPSIDSAARAAVTSCSNRGHADLNAPAMGLIIGGRFDPFGKTAPQFAQ